MFHVKHFVGNSPWSLLETVCFISYPISSVETYDVIVVGAGHAGCEAALAAARLGMRTIILTIDLDRIALMSCNPAIGGLGKGHLVREIDALGGEMARAIDETGIQFRRLNTSNGPAVRATRAQADKRAYNLRMKVALENEPNLHVHQGLVEDLIVENGQAHGVKTAIGEVIPGKTVILTTGTFLRGLMHIGLCQSHGGRAGDIAAMGLSDSLRKNGIELGRLKTGTCARLNGNTIDYKGLDAQPGDEPPPPFSFSTDHLEVEQMPCYITHTNPRTHDIIREGLDRSPLYTGVIKGIGPRYCPSIEDKVVRFPDRTRHHVFLEPEGRDTREVYPNGVSTSLPLDVQIRFLRTIPGLENVEITRPGYAVEYDFAPPTQLKPSLESKIIRNLYFAGQINGTSGYEEAAAQGLMAGINAAMSVRGEEPIVFGRHQAYIGVMIDDLVTRGVDEPYRMFTSRAEYRLILREDNADLRLTEIGAKIGLVKEFAHARFRKKADYVRMELARLEQTTVRLSAEQCEYLKNHGIKQVEGPIRLAELLRWPGVSGEIWRKLSPPDRDVPRSATEEAEIQIIYSGYIKKQEEQIKRLAHIENRLIPENFDYQSLNVLSMEVREKLSRARPRSLGQASRIPGITPAAIGILDVYLSRPGKP